MGGEAAAKILLPRPRARHVTSADILAPGDGACSTGSPPRSTHLDYLLPNDEQVLGFTGADDLVAGARALIERGVGLRRRDLRRRRRASIVDADGVERVPAFEVDVVDTTGCGDAFSAGFLRGLSLGRDRREAALLGCAAAGAGRAGAGQRPRRLRFGSGRRLRRDLSRPRADATHPIGRNAHHVAGRRVVHRREPHVGAEVDVGQAL